MNARNLLYIQKYNTASSKLLADDKVYTKNFLKTRGIGVAKLYHVIKSYEQLHALDFSTLPSEFVIKPNHGSGGDGIIVIEKNGNEFFQTVTGEIISYQEARIHMLSILDGRYSISSIRDQVVIEERLEAHEMMQELMDVQGLPDIRIITYKYVPVIAMLRLPTKESKGKGNLQQGAIGIGIDIVTGTLGKAYQKGKFFKKLPNGFPCVGVQIPHWEEFLLSAAKIQQVTKLLYTGVDLVHTKNGMKVLEINARPGLKIQICNQIGLLERLKMVDAHTIHNPYEGITLSKRLFSKLSRTASTKSLVPKTTLRLFEQVTFVGEERKTFLAKIDPHAQENTISVEKGEKGTKEILLKKKRLVLPFVSGNLTDADLVISGKYLHDFLIEPIIPSFSVVGDNKEVEEKILQKLDRKLEKICQNIEFMSYFKPINLQESRELFLSSPRKNPKFVYKDQDRLLLEDIEKDLLKLPRDIDHPLAPYFLKKIEELSYRIKAIRLRGTEEFPLILEKVYASPQPSDYARALEYFHDRKSLEKDTTLLSIETIISRLEKALKNRGLEHWKIVVKENMNIAMSVRKTGIIFLSSSAKITKTRLKELIVHEIESHIYRRENARFESYKILSRGLPGYLETEEGIAMYHQKVITPQEYYRYPVRGILGVKFAQEMGFLDLFHYIRTFFKISDESAFKHCVRVKRGFVNSGEKGAFTKDSLYFTGLRKVEDFFARASKKERNNLYRGKISVDDIDFFSHVPYKECIYFPHSIFSHDTSSS